eukprot:414647_1
MSWFICFAIIMVYANSQCSYVNYFGFPTPTETCSLVSSYNGNEYSYAFHCTSSGIEVQSYDNKYCTGSPSSSYNIDNSYDHSCDGSPDDCITSTYTLDKSSCSTTST